MRTWTRTTGLLFLAVASVYPTSAISATSANAANPNAKQSPAGAVRLLDDNAVPLVSSTDSPATQPATQPSTQPVTELKAPSKGQSVTASQVNVSDIGTVEIHVNEASLVEVLRMLSLQSQKNIISSKEVRGSITANLYDVTVREALDAILHANGYDYREKGNFIYVYTVKELAEMEKAARQKKTEVFRLFYTPAANAVNMLKPVMSNEGQLAFTTPAEVGIESGNKTGGNNHATEDVIVITDYAENLEAAKKILKEVDRRPQQVLIEATILKADLNETNQLGVDFTALGGVDFSSLAAVNGGTSSQSTGLQQALSGDIASNSQAGRVNNRGYIAGSVGGGGLQLGIVKDSVGLFIQALEGVTDTVVLANPKVLVLNKQKGEVHVGEEQGYRTAITTETSTTDNVQFLETGTHLIFRPFVGDNGYIRLEIHPEDSSGSVNTQGLPNKSVTQITTNVMVKDGHTIVIGGLFREATGRSRSQVPGLGSLPGIGAAFRQQTDTTTREEVIILLTPHLVKDENAYFAGSEEQMKDAERMRVGMRRGLMPWGRERLAESWYENAMKEMNKDKPDREKAMFHLNCAINLNPNFAEAMEMRTQVTGREMQAVDNSSIRSFVQKQIMSEKAHGITVTPVPAEVPIFVPTTEPSAKAGGKSITDIPTPTIKTAVAVMPATRPATVQATGPASRPAMLEAVAPTSRPASDSSASVAPAGAQDEVRIPAEK